jgi:hypothetical protein
MINYIQNIGDFFASNYFDEEFSKKVFEKSGYTIDEIKKLNQKITPLKERYFKFKGLFLEGRLRVKDKVKETHLFHTSLLKSLGYDGERNDYGNLFHISESEAIPVRHIFYDKSNQVQLMIMEMQALIKEDDSEPEGLFEQSYNVHEDSIENPPQKYHRSQWDQVFTVPEGIKISPIIINKAISELFLLEQHNRPKYILLLAGNTIFLLEQEKWFRGSYLQFDLEALFDTKSASPNSNDYALFYLLTSKEVLAPDGSSVLLDQLDEDSHKSAYEVTKDLKQGIIHAVEALANEALWYLKRPDNHIKQFDETDDTFEQEIKDDCLRIVYRLLFVFYAESRDDLDVLPNNDTIYKDGYSLEMLRDLEQVQLNSESSRNGYFIDESLRLLFGMIQGGYREGATGGGNKSFTVRHIDSPFFDNSYMKHLHKVKFRNIVWQNIISKLSLSKGQKNRTRGRISYANLGINQLGSVYESLLAYRGFYAEQDYIEVHKKNKPEEGTFLVPRSRRDDFEESEILKDGDSGKDRILVKGTFVYRLNGRDRQKSASYYTPEVLTKSTVKYTLKPIIERLEKKEITSLELLNFKLLEPAMGAAAFQNEMINQLASAYVEYRQKELKEAGDKKWRIEPDKYQFELQKVKAFIATNNTYGVDINPTAVELGKLSLWLNVIHRDMETPFFANRLSVGNAVIGSWLKVYGVSDLIQEYETVTNDKGKKTRKIVKKEWWSQSPRMLRFTPNTSEKKMKHGRKTNEVYHFLLPDKNMVPSANIKMMKEEYPSEVKYVSDWKKEWIKPLSHIEIAIVKALGDEIDTLVQEQYTFQIRLKNRTFSKDAIYGYSKKGAQEATTYSSFYDKSRLNDQRNLHTTPYFKLKTIMDYWCALWFWDIRNADKLPSRMQYWEDIASIMQFDLTNIIEDAKNIEEEQYLESITQYSMDLETDTKNTSIPEDNQPYEDTESNYTDREDLPHNIRLTIVKELAKTYVFFHPHLEFIEVFWERGGFDLIAGNPPWLKLGFESKEVISEIYPEVIIKNVSAPDVKKIVATFLSDNRMREVYHIEQLGLECSSAFLNAHQNFPLLVGQQTNLYKCIIENGFNLLHQDGYMGLIHPEGIFDDPNGKIIRKETYPRLQYHFQYINELQLFSEVHHLVQFSTNVYSGKKEDIHFLSISNLFHPTTIDGCFVHDGSGFAGGIKVKNEHTEKFEWNVKPHKDRLVSINQEVLKTLALTFETSNDWETSKLVSIHTSSILSILKKFSEFKSVIKDFESKISVCWDETNDVNAGIIKRNTTYPDYDSYELIYSGPHFHVANPLYKTPNSICLLNSDFSVIDPNEVSDEYLPRTNYTPAIELEEFRNGISGFEADSINKNVHTRKWIDYYKIGFRKMLPLSGERTLAGAILLPKTSHTNGVISVIFKDTDNLVELASLSSSIVFDFFLKTIGASNLTDSRLANFPLGVDNKYRSYLFSRVLLLNCLNKYYAPLWAELWNDEFKNDSWSKDDERLKPFCQLSQQWEWDTPLRNLYERRLALVEIDVITAMALGLTLDELILIYTIQFPVLQQNEDDTWYDTKGNIVFTCSKGLVGIGVDRDVWEKIRQLPIGETFEHTITKSELYNGKKVVYHAPFTKCNRVEDYKTAWKHFEQVFKGK